MITRIQPYSTSVNYTPNFKAKMINSIPIAKRGETINKQPIKFDFIERLQNIFFEAFPPLDPEYRAMIKLRNGAEIKENKHESFLSKPEVVKLLNLADL